ncbi:uncharacterized protein LOC143236592 isoform X2 [Tachypleus tridentatus]|uniref:uncharacterized protein LOC143236592 isoform X2 n=1 Tax=Tachypleus tridentatus TaxID=6853 RepID=UPI003FD106E8
MISKLPSPLRHVSDRIPSQLSVQDRSIPAPSTTNRNMNAKDRNRSGSSSGNRAKNGGGSCIPKAPSANSSKLESSYSTGIQHDSFIPQPRNNVVTRHKRSINRNHLRYLSSTATTSFLRPHRANTGVTLRHSESVVSTEYLTNNDNDNSALLYNNKQKCSTQKLTKRDFDVSKETSSSSGFSSSTDVSELLSVSPSMSNNEITHKTVSATKHLTKKTSDGRKSSNVKQVNSRIALDKRKDVQNSRINRLKSENEVKYSNTKSSALPRRAENKDSCSLPRSLMKDKESGKPMLVSRKETSKQGQQPNGAKGQMCRSIQLNKPIRQSKLSSLIPKTGQTIKIASSGSVSSGSDIVSVSNNDLVCGNYSLVKEKEIIRVPSEHQETSSTPKPTAAVKGTSKTVKKQSCLTITAFEGGKPNPSIGTRQTLAIQSNICQESYAPVTESKDTNEANRKILGGKLKPPIESNNDVSLPKPERTKQGSAISVAKVSPMMNTSIFTTTKENSKHQQDHSEERSLVNSNVPIGRSMRIKDETQGNSNNLLKLGPYFENLKYMNSDPIVNTEKITEINYKRSTNKNVSQESDDSGWNTDGLLADEAEDIIVNIKPMKPITHFPYYGYNRGLTPLFSSRNFFNKLQSPGLHFLSDVSDSITEQSTLSKHTITADNLTTHKNNPMERSFSSSESFINVDYSPDADSVDLATGYISDEDVLKSRFIYNVQDMTNGHLEESRASLNSTKVSNNIKDDAILDIDADLKPTNVLWNNSLQDISSISSGINDTLVKFSDYKMGSSLSSEKKGCNTLKQIQRDEPSFKCALPTRNSREKSRNVEKHNDVHTRNTSSGTSTSVKKNDNSVQTESSVFHQMSSSVWKRYTQQPRSEKRTLSHDRNRNRDTEVDRIKENKYFTLNRKNDNCSEPFDNYNSFDGQTSKQRIPTVSSKETKQLDLVDSDYSGHRSGTITSQNFSTKLLSQRYEDMRKFQSSRSLAVSGQRKRPASTPNVSSQDRENIYNSRDQGSNNNWKKNHFDEVMGGSQVNEPNRFGSFGGSLTSTRSLNITKSGLFSYKLDTVCKESKEKTKENVSACADTIVNDQNLFSSPAHSDGFETVSKNYAFTSSTLGLLQPEYRGSRSAASTPTSDNVMMPWLQPSTKERSQNPMKSRMKHGEGDTKNQSFTSVGNPYEWIRYSEDSSAGSVRSGSILRNEYPRSFLQLAPVSTSAQSFICAYTGGLTSKILNTDDEMHSSSLSLISTTSSLHLATKEKHAQEISKLKKELDQANEKVANLTTQLATNAHMVAAFEQSLSNMTDRFQHLTVTAEQKETELGELRNTIDDLKKQSTEAGLTKMALQSMQAVERNSVSSMNSQSSIHSNSSVRCDSTNDERKKKKKGWLRSSFSKAFSRSKKNKNGPLLDVEDMKQFHSDSSVSNTPSRGPYLTNGHFFTSSHSFSDLYEKEDECSLELMKDLRKQLREKDMLLTDIRLEALTSAHQIESLKDIVNKMKVEMTKLKQDNERLQRLVTSKSLNSSQNSLTSKGIVNSFEECLSTSENTRSPPVDTYFNDTTSDRTGKKITVSAYLCCHGNYCKVKTQHTAPQEVFIGSVSVNAMTKWDSLDNVVKRKFKEYLQRIDPVSNLGLCTESILSYHIGDVVRSKELEVPDLLPCGYLVGDNMKIHIMLKGTKQNSIDALAFETLIPKSLVQRYVSLLLEHRRLILCGLSGTGKTFLAQKLAEFLVFRSSKDVKSGAIATFSVDHKSAKKLQQYLSSIAEQFESRNNIGLPTVIILDNLHLVGSLSEVFNDFLNAKYQNSPFIIGTMNQVTCSASNLQLHHNFRWVLYANHIEPVNGFLGRFLRRQQVQVEVKSGVQNPELNKILDWIPTVWNHLNKFLETHSSSDVTIGPRLFLSCPLDVSSSQVWFTDLWNYSIIPYLMEAVREGLQLYSRRTPWKDPTEWVKKSYPWSAVDGPHCSQLVNLHPEDVCYEGHLKSNIRPKSVPTSQNEVEPDPLLNMLIRLQEATSYPSPQNDNESLRSNGLCTEDLESTL